MLNILLALSIAGLGLIGAWWSHRRLVRDRGHLDFAQTASRNVLTAGSLLLGIVLAYAVAFPPDGSPLLGQGKVVKNDAESGKMGRYRGEQ